MKTNSEFLLSCTFTYFPHESKVEMCICCFTYLCYCLNFGFLAQPLVYNSLKKNLGLLSSLTKNRSKTPNTAFFFCWCIEGVSQCGDEGACQMDQNFQCALKAGSENVGVRNFMEWLWVMQLQNQLGWIESLVANFRNSRKMKMLRLVVTQMFSPADWHISVHSSWSVFGSWAYLMI